MPDPSAFPALANTTGAELEWGPWRIPGVWGIMNNAFACVYLTFILFFSFWPPATPVVPSTMNYSSLVTGTVVLFSVVYYFVWAKKDYKGPIVEIE
jgi:choline transport protein